MPVGFLADGLGAEPRRCQPIPERVLGPEREPAAVLQPDGPGVPSLTGHHREQEHPVRPVVGGSQELTALGGEPSLPIFNSLSPGILRLSMADYHILLLGPPGAGKGTQATKLCEAYDLDHVSTGDALRANKDMETEYGTPRSFMEAGELVPDDVVNEVLAAALDEAEGYVLDGYPRNLDQVAFLDAATDLDLVIFFDVDDDVLVERLTGRRVCTECGENYHVEFAPPEEEGVCDVCGGDLHQREDDQEDVVRERLRVYEENTQPVIEQYRETSDLVTVDGEGAPEAVFERITDIVEG